jgi:hypothetical protein
MSLLVSQHNLFDYQNYSNHIFSFSLSLIMLSMHISISTRFSLILAAGRMHSCLAQKITLRSRESLFSGTIAHVLPLIVAFMLVVILCAREQIS